MKKFYNISIEGYGGEVVIGKISQDQFHFWQGKDHKLVNHLFNKTKVPKKAKLEKIIWEYDDICHTSGPEYNENQIIKISRVDKNGEFIRNKKGKIIKQYSMKIKNLKKYGSKINCIEDYPNNTVQIMNRWGNTVYEVGGYNNKIPVFEPGLKEIIQEEVQLFKNENIEAVFEKYLDNDLKNLVQTATRDYELSTEQIAEALTKALRELESQE